jgi:hypothetical protein
MDLVDRSITAFDRGRLLGISRARGELWRAICLVMAGGWARQTREVDLPREAAVRLTDDPRAGMGAALDGRQPIDWSRWIRSIHAQAFMDSLSLVPRDFPQ